MRSMETQQAVEQVITLPQWGPCAKCGHRWTPRKPERPIRCPSCGCATWHRAKQKKEVGDAATVDALR